MKHRRGFSIFEALIYLFLASIFMILLSNVYLNFFSFSNKLIEINNEYFDGLMVFDKICQDITNAKFLKFYDKQLIFKEGQFEFCFKFENKILYKMIGHFDVQINQWKKFNKVFLAKNIKNFTIEPFKNSKQLFELNLNLASQVKLKLFQRLVSARLS